MDGGGRTQPFEGLVVDNFAGGGGASTGIEAALGRPIDIAINHSPQAIAMHTANHPHTQHLCEEVWQVDPAKACAGRPVVAEALVRANCGRTAAASEVA